MTASAIKPAIAVLDRCEELYSTSLHLQTLAEAFEITGNTHMADELLAAASSVRRSAESIKQDTFAFTNARFESEKSSIGLVLTRLVDKVLD